MIPGAGATQRFPRLVGAGARQEMIYSGRFVDADEALGIGLINESSPPKMHERP